MQGLDRWKRLHVADSIVLTVHPDLNATQTARNGKSITLLGFILDPDDPQASDNQILDRLLHGLVSGERLFDQTARLGGRWILLVQDGEEVSLFHDALGLRQVFYTDVRHAQALWAASQPGVLAAILQVEFDDQVIRLIKSSEWSNGEYWLPGEASPFREVKHLLPNHYLNLRTGQSHRFWPAEDLGTLSLEECVHDNAPLLEGLVRAASNRFDLALSLTAGYDSRLVLASCRNIRQRISYMTVRKLGVSGNHADIAVPSLLLSRLGLKHAIVAANPIVDADFATMFMNQTTLPHIVWLPEAQAIFEYYRREKVAMTGSGGEVARCFYHLKADNEGLSARDVASLTPIGNSDLAIRSVETWFAGLEGIRRFQHIKISDLFYWEHRTGNWLAMAQSEFDTAWRDIFTPFNCRRLLANMLSVEERYRRPSKYTLHTKLTHALWPEVLSVPINPHNRNALRGLGAAILDRLTRRLARPA